MDAKTAMRRNNLNYSFEQPTWIGRSDCRSCDIFQHVLFSDLSPDDLKAIVEGIYEPIDHISYSAGAVLYQEGHVDNAIYTIRSGLVKLVRYLPDSKERIIRLMKTTESIGIERVLGRPYGHTAIALQPVTACRIPINVLQQLDEEQPRFYRKLMERWATTLFQADDYIMMLISGTVKQRIVHLIKWLTDYTESKDKNTVVLLSGNDMAAMLNTTAESVSRSLAELKRLNIMHHIKGDLYEYSKKNLLKYADEL
jgi:CRP-like cAMP-binding protein